MVVVTTLAEAIGTIIGTLIVGFVGIFISGIVSAITGRRVTARQPNSQAVSRQSRTNSTNCE